VNPIDPVAEAMIPDITHWLSVTQAARYLGVTNTSVLAAIAYEHLRAMKTPLGLLVDPVTVEQLDRRRRPERYEPAAEVVV